MFKGSEYRFPPSFALATTDSSEPLHRGNDDSTSHIIKLASMDNRRVDMGNDSGSDIVRGEQHPEERV